MATMTTVQYMQEAVKDIFALYEKQGRSATGTFGQMLDSSVEERPDMVKAKIYGAEYSEYTEYGRGSGKFPPVANILAWIRAKGIETDIKEESLAYLIARKISREGTKKQEPLLEAILTKPWLDGLGRAVLAGRVEEIKTILRSVQYGNN